MGTLFPDDADYEQARDRVLVLRRELERHNQLYYVEARPQISDREYDQLMHQLIELEQRFPELRTADSPSLKVGGEPIRGFVQVPHQIPMLSIDNMFEEQELDDWDQGLRKSLESDSLEYSLEYKIDGVALALIYERGVLVRAATRGNGMVGDDVTANARVLEGVPLRLLSEHAAGGAGGSLAPRLAAPEVRGAAGPAARAGTGRGGAQPPARAGARGLGGASGQPRGGCGA